MSAACKRIDRCERSLQANQLPMNRLAKSSNRKEADMFRIRQFVTIAIAALALVALAACGNGGGGGGSKSGPVEVVTHNAVGGGSDVFTRQMIKVMYENKIIDTNWPVRNVPAGDSIGAMSYMVGKKGNAGLIAQVTPTWLATPMTVANAKVSLADLTPITLVATEEQGIESSKVPVQFRAVMGAPDMPADAVQKYQDDLSKMVETDQWKTLTKDDGLVTQNLQDDKFTAYLQQQTDIVGGLLQGLGLRKDQ